MIRFAVLAALALAVLVPARAVAQPDLPGSFRVVDAKVEKDKIIWTQTTVVPVAEQIVVEVVRNGVKVTETREVTVYKYVPTMQAMDVKG